MSIPTDVDRGNDDAEPAQARHEATLSVDIAEREEAEGSRARLAALVESSEDAILSKTLEGIVTSWNHGAERMFGYVAHEMVGQSVTRLIPADHATEEANILKKIRRGERIQHYETVRVRKDGVRLNISLTVAPIRDANGTITGASKIARDITQQKRVADALREADKRKDEFLATLAHELRNPLAPIRQAALISQAPGVTAAQSRWAHAVIDRQVRNMALLLDDLLDISRVTRGTLELRKQDCELAAVVEAALETARPLLQERRHALSIELPPRPVHFMADPLRLAQVLTNLLTNAAKYTNPGGTITLRASHSAEHITLCVADTGIGIAAEAIEHLFTMFSQVKSCQERPDGGLGVGLALTKGLVELHGGTIGVHSPGLGCGSEFTVRLLLQPAQCVDATRTVGELRPATRSRRVLVADDNCDGADSLATLLRMAGHAVTVVHDGPQALAAFATVEPEIALLDIGMPGLNGYEVARRIRSESRGKDMVLIALTGWGQASDKTRALAAGFDRHLTKPVEAARLEELLYDAPTPGSEGRSDRAS